MKEQQWIQNGHSPSQCGFCFTLPCFKKSEMKGFREVRGSYQNIRVRGQLRAGRTAISGVS